VPQQTKEQYRSQASIQQGRIIFHHFSFLVSATDIGIIIVVLIASHCHHSAISGEARQDGLSNQQGEGVVFARIS